MTQLDPRVSQPDSEPRIPANSIPPHHVFPAAHPLSEAAATDEVLPPARTRRELRERETKAALAAAELAATEAVAAAAGSAGLESDALDDAEAAEAPERLVTIDAVPSSAAPIPLLPVDTAVTPDPAWVAAHPVTPAATSARRIRREKKPLFKRAVAQCASIGVLLMAGAMLVALSVPASVFETDATASVFDAPASTTTTVEAGQAILADGKVAAIKRDTFTATDPVTVDQLGTILRTSNEYTVDNSGSVRWPFSSAVPITDGFGARVSPCSGCSTQHKGTDFTPGLGAPIYAIADGVVSIHDVAQWGFGNNVYIEHVINGQKVTSVYAHMVLGSSALKVGDKIEKGDFIGNVGQTGAATGPHLHLEIHLDGVPVDAFLWLKANTGK